MNTYRLRILVLASGLALVLSSWLAPAATAGEDKRKHEDKQHEDNHHGECDSSPLLATGQTAPFTGGGATAVPDDGTLKVGSPLRYRDNGDGTITDLNTRLMWEKKSRDGGLHDVRTGFAWIVTPLTAAFPTIWEWLSDVNEEGGTGFAGYNDWRIPNLRELQTIIDYGRVEPAVDPVFNNGPDTSCSVLECSHTDRSFHWSSTSFALALGDPLVWILNFNFGFTSVWVTRTQFAVRAVRGGCLP